MGGAGSALFALFDGAAADEPRLHRLAGRHLLDTCSSVFRGTAPQWFRRFPLAGTVVGRHDGTGSEALASVPVWREFSGSETTQWRGIARGGALADEVRNRAQSRSVAAVLQPWISVLHRGQKLRQSGGCFLS